MEDIYQETIRKVKHGSKFHISFELRSLKVDGKYVIKNGIYDGELGVAGDTCDNILFHIETLYNRYRHSIPSERSDKQRKVYFQALSEKELSDDDMLFGERREYAQVALELYVLCSILNGSLVWDNFAHGKWFWKSPDAEGLIILKKWIISTNNNK